VTINPILHYPRTHYSTIPVFHHSSCERSELTCIFHVWSKSIFLLDIIYPFNYGFNNGRENGLYKLKFNKKQSFLSPWGCLWTRDVIPQS
jgi:hypothetical protein